MMNVGVVPEFIEVETVGGNSTPSIYKKDIEEIPENQCCCGALKMLHSIVFTMGGELILRL